MSFLFIITGHQCERYAAACLASVRSQSIRDWKAVVVDDASTDGTDELMAFFAQDSRIRTLRNDTNRGAAYSRLLALRHAAPEPDDVTVLLDLDDYLAHEKVLERVSLEYERGAQATYGSWTFEDGTAWPQRAYDKGIPFRSQPFYCGHLRTFKADLAAGLTDDHFKGPDGQWLRYCTDVALMLPVLDKADPEKVVRIEDVLYTYRRHERNSLTLVGRKAKKELERWIRT